MAYPSNSQEKPGYYKSRVLGRRAKDPLAGIKGWENSLFTLLFGAKPDSRALLIYVLSGVAGRGSTN